MQTFSVSEKKVRHVIKKGGVMVPEQKPELVSDFLKGSIV